MCFYNDDYDWFAELAEESDVTIAEPTTCIECDREMQVGEVSCHAFQQEHEECYDCVEGHCVCPKDEDGECLECKCEEPNFGETFECDRCQDCKKFLLAVEQHEKDEECPPGERQPAYGEMVNAIREFPRKEAIKYFRKACQMYPELKRSGYLKRLSGMMFWGKAS